MCLGQEDSDDAITGKLPDLSMKETAMTMKMTSRSAQRCALVALTLLTPTALAACGDDATTNSPTTIAETVEQYSARVQTECPGGDPGFDPFLTAHPTPTSADWVAFLPTPIKVVTDLRDCIAASHAPAVVADKVDAVVAAFDVVAKDFDKALAAATAGDDATVEKWVTQVHDIDQPKIDVAIAAVGVG
jgi:hypothetical protein